MIPTHRTLPRRHLLPTGFALFACTVLAAAQADEIDDKLDQDLDRESGRYAIFVRMEDQMFKQAGDYEAFCKQEDAKGAKRRELRATVVKTLRESSDRSWEKVEKAVEKLEGDGQLENLQRYWIVNGFACQATGKACRELAGLDAVSFVYRQRVPLAPLHFRPVALADAPGDEQKKVFEQVLADWQDAAAEEAFSTECCEIPWNLERIQADKAWRETKVTGQGVTVALCDTGLMLAPSLTSALWKNPGETLNGKDDDGNGYIDDLFGYDFAAQNWYCLGDAPQITHGSMCGGIIAGRPMNKQKMITGVAPRSRLMVLRGMGFLLAYEYALANGADVMSMSYMFPGIPLGDYRGVYRLAHEHLAAGGVVAVGGAGNFAEGRGAQPKGAQIALPKDIPCVIAVAGILQDGTKAPVGSEGPCHWEDVKFYNDYPRDKPLIKPDVTGCFGGYPVWGRPALVGRIPGWERVTDEGDNMGLVNGPQGNSFSGPHAAGVAALMLSAAPDLPAWKVKELMESACTDIGPEGRDTTFGAGLLDALKAVQSASRAAAEN